MSLLNRGFYEKLLYGLMIVLGTTVCLNAMEREKTVAPIPKDVKLTIFGSAENHNLSDKMGFLKKCRRVCRDWNNVLRQKRDLITFFEKLVLQNHSETQLTSIKTFLCHALSSENNNPAELLFLEDLYIHFKSGENPLQKLISHFFFDRSD